MANGEMDDGLKRLLAKMSFWCGFNGSSVDAEHQALEDYTDFLRAYKECKRTTLLEQDLMREIPTTLSGIAREWYFALPNRKQLNFETYLEALKERFGGKDKQTDLEPTDKENQHNGEDLDKTNSNLPVNDESPIRNDHNIETNIHEDNHNEPMIGKQHKSRLHADEENIRIKFPRADAILCITSHANEESTEVKYSMLNEGDPLSENMNQTSNPSSISSTMIIKNKNKFKMNDIENGDGSKNMERYDNGDPNEYKIYPCDMWMRKTCQTNNNGSSKSETINTTLVWNKERIYHITVSTFRDKITMRTITEAELSIIMVLWYLVDLQNRMKKRIDRSGYRMFRNYTEHQVQSVYHSDIMVN